MKKLIAVPTVNQKLSAHFGKCKSFAIIKILDKNISSINYVSTPIHSSGTYPDFLISLGVDVVITNGIGMKAYNSLLKENIQVFIGIDSESPENLVKLYLKNQLNSGQNLCDH